MLYITAQISDKNYKSMITNQKVVGIYIWLLS